jgi:hypothetical protein
MKKTGPRRQIDYSAIITDLIALEKKRKMRSTYPNNQEEIAKKFNISPFSVWRIRKLHKQEIENAIAD